MIRIGSDTDIGMNRNSSDLLGMNFYPILSPGRVFRNIDVTPYNIYINVGKISGKIIYIIIGSSNFTFDFSNSSKNIIGDSK